MADVLPFRPRTVAPIVAEPDRFIWNCGTCGCDSFTVWNDGPISCAACGRTALGLKATMSRKLD